MTKNIPIVVFAYNRATQLRMVLERLVDAENIERHDVIVYIDGPKRERDVEGVAQVEQAVKQVRENRLPRLEIVRREKNYGCQKNISTAITSVINQYGCVIVVEDDVLVSRTFLTYMDAALEFYKDDERIWGVNGHQCPYMRIPQSYPYDIYLSPRNLCTGWATWADRWNGVDFEIRDWPDFIANAENRQRVENAGIDIRDMLDKHYRGKLNSWALPCTYYMIKNNLYMIEPRRPLTKNVGFGIESVHCGNREEMWAHQKYYNFLPNLVRDILSEPKIMSQFKYVYNDPRLLHRIIRKGQRIFKSWQPLFNYPR